MDNANLESLKLSPGRLNPKFNPSVTDYTVMLSSAATQVKVEAMTSDEDASYEIKVMLGQYIFNFSVYTCLLKKEKLTHP